MSRIPDENILRQLRQKICSGGFDKITFLPSERKMAEEYQVGRGVIRGALKILSEENLIYKVPKRGFRLKKRSDKRIKQIIVRLPVPVSAKAYEAMGLLAGICSGANEIFAEVILSTPPAVLNLSEVLERYNSNDIQGVVFLEGSPDIPVEEFVKAGIPCVIANSEEEKEIPCVSMDYRGIGRLAGKELIKNGYRRIGVYSGPAECFHYKELLAGFRGVLAEENMIISGPVHISENSDDVAQSIKMVLSQPAEIRPDAIFTLRDYRAAQVYSICEELGLKIPEDIGVISFDGITWPGAEKAQLISIAEDVAEIGRQSVFLLQKQFEFGYSPVRYLIRGVLLNGNSLKKMFSPQKVIYPHD